MTAQEAGSALESVLASLRIIYGTLRLQQATWKVPPDAGRVLGLDALWVGRAGARWGGSRWAKLLNLLTVA